MTIEERIDRIEDTLRSMIEGHRFIRFGEINLLSYRSVRAYNIVRGLRVKAFTFEDVEFALTEKLFGIGPAIHAHIAAWWEEHMGRPMNPPERP